MPLVAAMCTQCGGNIETDDSKEAGICRHCGTPYITEKAINNYNTHIHNTTNIKDSVINIYGRNVDNLRVLADELYLQGEVNEAHKYYTEILEHDASDVEAKFRKHLCLTNTITRNDAGKIEKSIELLTSYVKYITGSDLSADSRERKMYDAFYRVMQQILIINNIVYNDNIGTKDPVDKENFEGYLMCADSWMPYVLNLLKSELSWCEDYPSFKTLIAKQSDQIEDMTQRMLYEYRIEPNGKFLSWVFTRKLSKEDEKKYHEYRQTLEEVRKAVEPGYSLPPLRKKGMLKKFLQSI